MTVWLFAVGSRFEQRISKNSTIPEFTPAVRARARAQRREEVVRRQVKKTCFLRTRLTVHDGVRCRSSRTGVFLHVAVAVPKRVRRARRVANGAELQLRTLSVLREGSVGQGERRRQGDCLVTWTRHTSAAAARADGYLHYLLDAPAVGGESAVGKGGKIR